MEGLGLNEQKRARYKETGGATKRFMYRQVHDNVVRNQNRRALTQGRLVMDVPQVYKDSQTGKPVLAQGQEPEVLVSHVDLPPSKDDLQFTPRRTAPGKTEQESPRRSPPVGTLDLSDVEAEDEVLSPPRSKSPLSGTAATVRQVPHCLVMDASAEGPEPKMVITYERSPVTIVSHAQRSPTDFGPGVAGVEGHSHWKVDVDQVPKIKPGPRAKQSSVRTNLPLGPVNLNQEDSDDEEDTLVARLTREERKSASPRKKTAFKMPQPDFDASSESEKVDSNQAVRKPPVEMELASDSDTCSLFEYVPRAEKESVRVTDAGTAKSQKAPPKSAKKKKGERVVPSRYMQSAMLKNTNTSASASLDKTQNATVKKRLNLTSTSQGSRGPTPGSRGQRRPSEKTGSTPRARASGKGKTSTPTHDEAPHMASCDASAINPELSMFSFDAGVRQNSSDTSQSPMKHKKLDPRVQKQRVDLHYARYLQWLFLDTKIKQTLRQQEQDAMKQMHQLWKLKEEETERVWELEKEIVKLKHLQILGDQTEMQEAGLEELVKILPSVKKHYFPLTHALDLTRHQIPTKGVYIPEDEESFVENLQQVLRESEQLLAELISVSKSRAPAIHEFSSALQAIDKAVDSEWQELDKCAELLSALTSLTTHETSLRIQDMQTR